MACLHEHIRRLETTPVTWCCETCDEHFVPGQTLVTPIERTLHFRFGTLDDEEE